MEAIETNCWPLHPQPHSYEWLEAYVHRLADSYGVRYDYFCRRALGIPYVNSQVLRFQKSNVDALRRLSDGTGVPIEQFEQMTLPHVFQSLMDELQRIAATPEGLAELERLKQIQWLQNS